MKVSFNSLARIIRLFPITAVLYSPKLNRRNFYGLVIGWCIFMPFFGFFRRNYIKNQFKKQLQHKQQQSQGQIMSSLENIDISFGQNAQYLIIVSCKIRKNMKQNPQQQSQQDIAALDNNEIQIIEQQRKKLFSMIQQINAKSKSLNDAKIIFIGDKFVYQSVKDQNKDQIKIDFKGGKVSGFGSKIFLIAKDDNQEKGYKFLNQWQLGTKITAIVKQITRHKYKKYLSSVNF